MVEKTLQTLWKLRASTDEETSDGAFLAINTINQLQEKIAELQRINTVMDGHLVRNGKEIIEKENQRAELEFQCEQYQKVLKNVADMKNVGFAPEYVLKRYSEYAQKALIGIFEETS